MEQISPKSRSGTHPYCPIWSAVVQVLVSLVVVIVGGLTHLPALTLGPIAEQLLMLQGRAF